MGKNPKQKNKPRIQHLLALLILLGSFEAHASFRGLPVIASTPETGVQYGALVIQNLDEEAVDGKLSTIQYVAINSTRNQQRLVIRPTLYFMDYKLKAEPRINYSSFPDKFYGISNDADEILEENFTSEYLLLRMDLRYHLFSNIHLQFLSSSDDREVTQFEEGGLIDERVDGLMDELEYKLKSIGFGLAWDSRDVPRYPDNGYYLSISRENYKGGIYDYDEDTIDLRAYYSVGENQLVATHFIQIEQDGTIPFINLATIGGSDVVRGYYQGRYRAPKMQAVQIEFRKYGYAFFGFGSGWTAFAATGRVDARDSIADDPKKLHSAVGIGGHVFFNPEDKTTIRADIAFGEDGTAFYLMLDQAF